MTLALVLVIAAQIGTAHTITFHCTDLIDATTVIYCESNELPISTRRVEPLVVEPERAARFTRVVPSEPPIVPAVQKTRCHEEKLAAWSDGQPGAGITGKQEPCMKHDSYWTCTDTRRVLLTAENGTRHCVLFEGAR